MKKRLCILLLGIVFAASPALTVFAENEVVVTTAAQQTALDEVKDNDEDIKEEIEAEIAEEIEEITINSTEDFLQFAEHCKLDTWSVNKKVVLTSNISLLGTGFEGIPTFGGIFDGQGHIIGELNIDDDRSFAGLFVNVQKSAVISNLTVKGTIIPKGEHIVFGGIAANNSGMIQNCNFEGVITANDYVGGIAGKNELSGDIRNCTSKGYIYGTHFVGGIAGENKGNIFNCTNEALVNTTNTDTQITIDSMGTLNKVISLIKNAKNTKDDANADVTATDIGGIAGQSIGIISRCLNEGNVGYEHVGYNIGGIAGRQSGYIYKCTNNAKILGRKDVGGIVGQAEPYLTVDLSSDIAYQLTEAIGKLHDIVTATLNDTKNQSNTITNRLSAIQQFTDGAIKDAKYIATGTVDYANGVSSAATQAFSRIDYVMDEASKKDGVLDKATNAFDNVGDSATSMLNTVKDLNLESYMSEADKAKYNEGKEEIETATATYTELYAKAARAFYNKYIDETKWEFEETSDLSFTGVFGEDTSTVDKIIESYNVSGSWQHADETIFPGQAEGDQKLAEEAAVFSEQNAIIYADEKYLEVYPGHTYSGDMADGTAKMTEAVEPYISTMADNTRSDAIKAMQSLDEAADDLTSAAESTKKIVKDVAGMDSISFPQFSAEYRQHTASFVDNMQGMNDNFGLLNSEMNNATGVIVDDLQAMNDQFNTIMLLFTDAVDGVLEMDYTQNFEDISYEEAKDCTDATIDDCTNYGVVEGDIDTSGIAGTMAIEYDFDRESDATGIKDARLNTSYITKCVLRNNSNYSDITGEKNYVGGICGLQEMGIILQCANLGNLKANNGDYVGGICGKSLSCIIDSHSRGILSATSYVGGIAGEGTNIKDCSSLVKIQDTDSFYGAVAGQVSDDGTVRNNFFISDELAGIDRSSYSLKAEPVEYNEENLPHDFKTVAISFVLDDEDGQKLIKKVNKNFNSSVKEDEYPKVDKKDGYYVLWDKAQIDKLRTDEIITAKYIKYRTTIAEKTELKDEFYQGEILVDGQFKEDDYLTVIHDKKYDVGKYENLKSIKDFNEYETLTVSVPDDGRDVHSVRIRPRKEAKEAFEDYDVYIVKDGNREVLEKTGTMGDYYTYDIAGSEFVLDIKFKGADKKIYIAIIVGVAVILILITLNVIIAILIRRHGGKLPGIFKKAAKNVSEKIESKEQIFYDDSKDNNKDK